MTNVALMAFLKPLQPYLAQAGVSELCINKPHELWLEAQGQFVCHHDTTLSMEWFKQLAHLIAEANNKNLSETKPLLSATLPTGERCQFVLPPACDKGQMICAIRKPSVLNLTLNDWAEQGAFATVKQQKRQHKTALVNTLNTLYQAQDWQALIAHAVKAKLNIVISGATSSAKTTFLNSCLKEIAPTERIVTIEGVREVQVTLPNTVHLIANEDDQNPNAATMLDLLKATLRLRPDRILLSELRGQEAYPFLRACISGHPGSLTTLHADSIEHALDQLCFMLSEAPELRQADELRLRRIIQSSVQVIIQMSRNEQGMRVMDDIYLQGMRDDSMD